MLTSAEPNSTDQLYFTPCSKEPLEALRKLASAARKVGAKLKGLAEKFKQKRKAKKDAKSGHSDQKQKPKHEDDHDGAEKEKRQKEEKDKKNQELLAKAQAELPRKICAVLARGTRGITLQARLAIWRVQYRLTS